MAIAGTCVGVSHHAETVKKEQSMQLQMQALKAKDNQDAIALAEANKPKPRQAPTNVVIKDLA